MSIKNRINIQMGTKWFTFYTKVRPWFACLSAFTVIADYTEYPDVYADNWWLALCFLMGLLQPLLCILTFIKSTGDYIDFVHFVKGVLLFEAINMTYQNGVEQYIKSNFDFGTTFVISIIIFLIYYFVWYRLNVKYFEKRIPMRAEFVANNLQQNYESNPINFMPEAHKIQFCRKCGEKLMDNGQFCGKCGTEVVKELNDNDM